jgi:hypothetical protein
LDLAIFTLGLILISVGALADFYTTYIFTREGGIELERNTRVRSQLAQGKYTQDIILEVALILGFSLIDSLGFFNSLFFFSLILFIIRGLVATDNLKVIIKSRTISMKTLLEQELPWRTAYSQMQLANKTAYKLSELLEASIYSIILLTIFFMNFPYMIIIRSILIGLIIKKLSFFIVK